MNQSLQPSSICAPDDARYVTWPPVRSRSGSVAHPGSATRLSAKRDAVRPEWYPVKRSTCDLRRLGAPLPLRYQTRCCRVVHESDAANKFKLCAGDSADRSGYRGPRRSPTATSTPYRSRCAARAGSRVTTLTRSPRPVSSGTSRAPRVPVPPAARIVTWRPPGRQGRPARAWRSVLGGCRSPARRHTGPPRVPLSRGSAGPHPRVRSASRRSVRTRPGR